MLTYEAEFNMFRSILSQFNLKTEILPINGDILAHADQGIRKKIFSSQISADIEKRMRGNMKEKVIYKVTDEFACSYALLLLPEFDDPNLLVAGPYLRAEMDQAGIERYIEERGIDRQWTPILENYFRTVPYVPDDKLISASLNSLAERIWGVRQFTVEEIISGIPESIIPLTSPPDSQVQEDILSAVRRIEQQYYSENRFIEAISQGRPHRASIMLSNFSRAALENRTAPLRNIKNYSIILNTLMRKAVEQGGVHPLHIDRLSSEFARKIENASSVELFPELWQDMAKKYCRLVKSHATTNYSQLVQYIITRVDFDLTADLSLKANAELLNVNASYLSSLFKKETGKTLTDYVNQKRVEYAVYLLRTTDLPISHIGQRCGIQDDNYFTKIFKKYTSVTPKQYRQQNSGFRRMDTGL